MKEKRSWFTYNAVADGCYGGNSHTNDLKMILNDIAARKRARLDLTTQQDPLTCIDISTDDGEDISSL